MGLKFVPDPFFCACYMTSQVTSGSANNIHTRPTRMHSSRMRTAHSSNCSGGGGLYQAPPRTRPLLGQVTPQDQIPRDQTPPDQAPPAVDRHITLPQTSFAGGKNSNQTCLRVLRLFTSSCFINVFRFCSASRCCCSRILSSSNILAILSVLPIILNDKATRVRYNSDATEDFWYVGIPCFRN